ncbi:hypothetical protein [Comamonas testosteroni]|uniref:hypothetical protein n=1 Tax=Comamonas testosteroni TaxID=285 RepID=UPI0026F074B2|nr:hypothetical protein [Comamonas testosteroni]
MHNTMLQRFAQEKCSASTPHVWALNLIPEAAATRSELNPSLPQDLPQAIDRQEPQPRNQMQKGRNCGLWVLLPD